MATQEDITAEKLKGNNCLIKFKDGEELFLHVNDLDDKDERHEWFTSTEQFIHNGDGGDYQFPAPNIAVDSRAIKYVKLI